MSGETPQQFGTVEFQGKDIALPPQQFDRIATGGRGELLLISMVAPTQIVKAARAILNGGAKAFIQAAGVKTRRPGDDEWYARQPGRLVPTSDGYHTYVHKLGYGLAHAYFVTKMPGFLRVVSHESLWQELNDVRFTTPLLRDWIPFIEKQLRTRDLLEDAHVFGCRCGVLSATTAQVDDIVSQGIKDGWLTIPSEARPIHAVA
jgi:uncharacterized protein Usg